MSLLKSRSRYNDEQQRQDVERLLWQLDEGEIGSIGEMDECCNLVRIKAFDGKVDPMEIAGEVMQAYSFQIRKIVQNRERVKSERRRQKRRTW